MNEHKFWYLVKRANGWARAAIFPTFFVGSILTYCSNMAKSEVTWFEMPVIAVKCKTREPSERGEPEAKTSEQPFLHCEEVVTWAGDDQEEIKALVYTKAEEIANTLFAYPQNPALVKESAAKTIEYFQKDSDARSEFKRRMEETIIKSASRASGWKITSSYVRFIKREKKSENRWVAKFSGITVEETDNQKGRDVSVMLSFKPTRKGEREDSQQALVVTEWEITK